jgi:ATP-dependent DNA helicase RecG
MGDEKSIAYVRGVGPEVAKKFAQLGIATTYDLIDNYPRRYDDYSAVTTIKGIKPGPVTIQAVIKQATGRYVRRGMHITEAVASDDTDSVRIVWFNQPYRAQSLKPGEQYYISGQFQLSRQRFAIMNPSAELVSSFPINTARIIPIYREVKGLTSGHIRKVLRELLPVIENQSETLPEWLIQDQELMSRDMALRAIHFPSDGEELEVARRRLGFEEVLELSLASLLNKYELMQDKALSIPFKTEIAREFVHSLPFELTNGQRAVAYQLFQDMSKTQPMNRLMEGDVGSGKTVVATMAAVMALGEGYQVALMAPTELLARQHAETISRLLTPVGLEKTITLLIGSLKPKQKATAYEHIAKGDAKFVIGTHALIQSAVKLPELGLAIVDEQHRFGVEQRKALMAKAGHMPHLLSLTATPIPRSLALTLYGEMDVSILDEKPAGRQTITTKICSPNSKKQLYEDIEKELVAGRQLFVVCPLIAESVSLQVSSAEKVHEELAGKVFKKWRVGLLHGKQKADDKAATMEQFVRHELDILVSTTVIEVGVDVPNASVMLIEAADRFGLAQIHQLRGRVGRGGHKGYCYLMMSDSSTPPERLRALERNNDGFKLAELDLQLRGPGAMYGTMQHGQLDLRVAKLTDMKLIASARQAAQLLIDKQTDLTKYPTLFAHVSRLRAVTNLN